MSSSPWASSVVLGSGETAFIRPIEPGDQDDLAAFHLRQSPESVYRRFFSPKPELSARELEHFTTVDMDDRAALVVTSHDEFIAWASYERWPGRDEAEAAFMVDDARHGEGIATLLLEHLAAVARSNGITRFTAEVLGDNRAMLAVFAKAGWPLQRRFDSGVVDLDWELDTTTEFIDSVERREHRADARAVARVLLPRAIAVIGASDRAGTVGASLWTNVTNSVDVPVYAVNPRQPELGGTRAFASIDELPDDVSLAIIAVPAATLLETIDACIAKRMRGAVVVTNLDGHSGDRPSIDVDAVVRHARRNGLRIIGPSSMGVASLHPASRLQASLVDITLPPGGVAISMQSGTLGASLLREAGRLHMGVSWFVSLGDKSDISANDLLQFWETDASTTVIAMYTESFGNPSKFARIARRVSMSRPIVAVRTGAATSRVGTALFEQAGLIEVPTVQSLLDTARVLATQPILRGDRVAVLTNSRSPGTLAAAALRAHGLDPVDPPHPIGWRATPDDYESALDANLGHHDVDGVLVIYAPAVVSELDTVSSAVHAAATNADKPVVAVVLGGSDGPITTGSAVPTFTFPEPAAAALGRSRAYARWLATEAGAPAGPVRPVDPERAKRAIDDALQAGTHVAALLRHEHEILLAYGLTMPPATEATPSTALEVAREIGYPLAIKSTRRRPGRSARAGVALDVNTDDEVIEAVATMTGSLGDDARDLIVQEMAPPGVDLRIHCTLDDRLGPIVAVGLGGAQADAIGDRVERLAPVSPAAARAMLGESRAMDALDRAGFDPTPMVDAVVQAAQLASDHPEIRELDLNPVMVSDHGAAIADATIVLEPHDRTTGPIRRLD
ncbi:MAG: GNAT family N-acetyltransferase [Actinomycetota bacterium]